MLSDYEIRERSLIMIDRLYNDEHSYLHHVDIHTASVDELYKFAMECRQKSLTDASRRSYE